MVFEHSAAIEYTSRDRRVLFKVAVRTPESLIVVTVGEGLVEELIKAEGVANLFKHETLDIIMNNNDDILDHKAQSWKFVDDGGTLVSSVTNDYGCLVGYEIIKDTSYIPKFISLEEFEKLPYAYSRNTDDLPTIYYGSINTCKIVDNNTIYKEDNRVYKLKTFIDPYIEAWWDVSTYNLDILSEKCVKQSIYGITVENIKGAFYFNAPIVKINFEYFDGLNIGDPFFHPETTCIDLSELDRESYRNFIREGDSWSAMQIVIFNKQLFHEDENKFIGMGPEVRNRLVIETTKENLNGHILKAMLLGIKVFILI